MAVRTAPPGGSYVRLARGYPFLEAEVIFGVRSDWARKPEDILARRTRLAFLNKDLAVLAVPRVVELMGDELGWDEVRRAEEVKGCLDYLRQFGVPSPVEGVEAIVTDEGIKSALLKWDYTGDEGRRMTAWDAVVVSEILGSPLTEAERKEIFAVPGEDGGTDSVSRVTVSKNEFSTWWKSRRGAQSVSPLNEIGEQRMASERVQGSGTLFG